MEAEAELGCCWAAVDGPETLGCHDCPHEPGSPRLDRREVEVILKRKDRSGADAVGPNDGAAGPNDGSRVRRTERSAGRLRRLPPSHKRVGSEMPPQGQVLLATRVTTEEAASFDREAGSAGKRLGDVLVTRGLATRAQVERGVEMQREGGGRLGDILVQAGVVNERDLVDALAEFLGMVVADLRRFKPDAEALALVPEELARQHLVVPISLDDGGLARRGGGAE